jgi:hypothetical protein
MTTLVPGRSGELLALVTFLGIGLCEQYTQEIIVIQPFIRTLDQRTAAEIDIKSLRFNNESKLKPAVKRTRET